jgi:hypothetical protein
VSTQPFVTRVSSFDVIDGVWVAIIAPCNRCTRTDSPAPIVHTFILPEPPSRDGGGFAVKAPCRYQGSGRTLVAARNKADGRQMMLVWLPETVDAAQHMTLPEARPKQNNTIAGILAGRGVVR